MSTCHPRLSRLCAPLLLALCTLPWFAPAQAVETQAAEATAAPVTELRFGEMFQRPIGPRGLAPSSKLLALNGLEVRMVGYMVDEELPTPGRLILTPLPSSLGDEDESLADDLPPQAVFVHLSGTATEHTPTHRAGLIRLQGRLSVGSLDESDGHVSTVRLLLDDDHSGQFLPAATNAATAPHALH